MVPLVYIVRHGQTQWNAEFRLQGQADTDLNELGREQATRNGRRLEVTTSRGVVEVSEVTRGGSPVRTGRFMASRLIALVEHPAQEGNDGRVDVTTRRRMRPPATD